MEHNMITPQEVADILKIKKNTVYEMIKRGDLKASKMGKQFRISNQDLAEYLQVQGTIRTGVGVGESTPFDNITQSHARENMILVPSALSGLKEERGHEIILCGQDIILDILCNHLLRKYGMQVMRSYLGSYNGLYAMYQGEVDLATAHLWDGDTDSYNKEYVRRMLPGEDIIMFHLAMRNQGFYVAKGNPKKIKTFFDLSRGDVTIVNREKGSGTRILLDEQFRLNKINKKMIKGYDREMSTHLACACAVARGGADVALGNEKSSVQVQDVDFIPLKVESYDLVIRSDDLKKVSYQNIITVIQSEEFRMEVEGLGGYDVTGMGEVLH